MKFFYIILLLIFHINSVQAEETNSKLFYDIDRLSNDLQDLQSFVYNNLNPNNQENKISTTEVASSDKVSDLENALKKINFRLEKLEIKISDLYSLYLNQNTVTLSTIKSSDGIIVQQDSSSIVSETNETKQLGQISLNDLEGENKLPVDNAEIIETENELLDDIQDEAVQEVNSLNVERELIAAKNFMGSLDNSRAIQSLSKIIESRSDNRNVISESYYWLGRTYFINNNFIEAIKYFGIRHRDFEDIQNFKADNYYWLAKSLVKIGDKENACLVMEDIIFSNDYSSELGIVEDSKSLQEEQSCGLIID